MLALMVIQVDQLDSYAYGFDYSLFECFGLSYYGYNKSVVVDVIAVVEQFNSFFAAKRVYNLIYLFKVAPFAELGTHSIILVQLILRFCLNSCLLCWLSIRHRLCSGWLCGNSRRFCR